MCHCVSRGWWEQDNYHLKLDGLELDNSKLTIWALELDNSTFSALELDHSRVRTCAHELDSSQWGALELVCSKYKNGWNNQVGINQFQLDEGMDEKSWK